MIRLTDAAVAEVKRILVDQQADEGTSLRLGVSGGGCSGFSYIMTFDKESREDDQIAEYEGLSVLLGADAVPYLDSMVVDFNDDVNKRGFVFNNPNASDSCGCGSSFSV
jgi:iron-sulfur cluster assembly accessory protein